MSLKLLKYLNSNNQGSLKKFIDKFDENNEPRICWYPSAGSDFRALLYLDPTYSKMFPVTEIEPNPPDIFLFTDYCYGGQFDILDSNTIYSGAHTTVTFESYEELPKINTTLDEGIVDFYDDNPNNNRVIFMNIKIKSDVLGEISYPVIYVIAENESFCAKILIPNDPHFSHIIHVRYGGGCGGGGSAQGYWILNTLKKFNCEVFVCNGYLRPDLIEELKDLIREDLKALESDMEFAGDSGKIKTRYPRGDAEALKLYPELAGGNEQIDFKHIRIVKSCDWSDYGDVVWNLVL